MMCEYCELIRPTTLEELESGEFCQCDQFDCANCQDTGLVCNQCENAWCADTFRHILPCGCERGQALAHEDALEHEHDRLKERISELEEELKHARALAEHKLVEQGLGRAQKHWLKTEEWQLVRTNVPPFFKVLPEEEA